MCLCARGIGFTYIFTILLHNLRAVPTVWWFKIFFFFFTFHFIIIFPRKIFSNSRFLTHFLVTCSIYLVFNISKWSEEYEYLDHNNICFLVRGGFCCNISKNNTDNVTIICNDYISDTQYVLMWQHQYQ